MVKDKVEERAGLLFDRFVTYGFKLNNIEAPWEYSEEPHVQRRKDILEKHPEVKKLMGCDPWIALYVSMKVVTQIGIAWLMRDASWRLIVPVAWVVGATINHWLGGAIHEIGHNLAFGHKYPLCNRALGMWANLPLVVPLSISYKKYHSDHHKYLGHDVIDVDTPTWIECKLFRNPLTKLIWLACNPIFHGIRPFFKNPVPIQGLEVVNFFVQMGFNYAVFSVFGIKSLMYLLVGTLLGLGLHPVAGHFISEHYLFQKGQATTSYYGPLNFFIYNLGYHVEHHDFPYIPCSRLPDLKRIAHEFYDDLPYHTSWIKVLWDFVMRPDMGPSAHGIEGLPVGLNEDDMEAKARMARQTNNNKKL
jgi:sphingolipid delta-4 desaturase